MSIFRALAPCSLALGLGLLTAASPTKAQSDLTGYNIDQAIDLVESLYADNLDRIRSGREPVMNDPAAARLYFEDSLAIQNLAGKVGFDPLFNAQDAEIDGVSASMWEPAPIIQGAATVVARFTNFGEAQEVHYTLVQIPPHKDWQITGIYYPGDGKNLSDFMDGIARASSQGPEITLYHQRTGATVPESEEQPRPDTATQTASDTGSPTKATNSQSANTPGSGRDQDLLIVLDGSGSMWGQIDGVAKISTAKEALSGLVNDFGPNTNIGLMAYGHRRQGDCADTQVIVPPGQGTASAVNEAIQSITPRGKTPLAASLMAAGDVLSQRERRADILLISDGLETCGGDPCAAAQALADRGIDTHVHVVGFDLNDQEAAALQCIVENGRGRYFAANSAAQFTDALKQAAAATQDTERVDPPETAVPPMSVLFEEHFDGPRIEPALTTVNAVPEMTALTGASTLLVAAAGETRYDGEAARNRYVLDQALPEGDFDLVLDFKMRVQTGAELVTISAFEDVTNHITADLWVETQGCGSSLNLSLVRDSPNSDRSGFDIDLFDGKLADNICTDGRQYADQVLESLDQKGATLRLKRRGRELSAVLDIELPPSDTATSEVKTVETEPVTVLRFTGKPAFLVGQYKAAREGEAIFEIERVAIEVPTAQ